MRLHTRAFSLFLALFMGVIAPGWSLFSHQCLAMGRLEVSVGDPKTNKKGCCTDTTDATDAQAAKVKANCCKHTESKLQLKDSYAAPDSTRVKQAKAQGPAPESEQPTQSNFELDFLLKAYDFVIHLFDGGPQNRAGRDLVLFLHKLVL